MPPAECAFTLFRQKYWAGSGWLSGSNVLSLPAPSYELDINRDSCSGVPAPLTNQQLHRQNLRHLDLKSLQREEGPPSESQARRQKFQYYEKRCSEVAEGLFLGSDYVARSRDVLQQAGVTHVINCVGFIYPEYFKDELVYRTLFLQDTPTEDIMCVLYEAFEFIEAARNSNGKVLVHCSQGVSRSASIAIAYLMWKLEQSYDDIYQQVKLIRGVANPNIGFTCQLLNWYKRRKGISKCGRLYKVSPHSQADPLFLVAKSIPLLHGCDHHVLSQLDPRFVFILHAPDATYVWKGAKCLPAFLQAGVRAASLLGKYESAVMPPLVVEQGEENDAFVAVFTSSGQLDQSDMSGIDTPTSSGVYGDKVTAMLDANMPMEHDGYTDELEWYYKAEKAGSHPFPRSGPGALEAPSRRPESPSAKEGRSRKIRRAETDRSDELGYGSICTGKVQSHVLLTGIDIYNW